MGEGFDILAKMDPMARRCLAAVEAMQKGIDENDRDLIEVQLRIAKNALSMVEDDLQLHDSLSKSARPTNDSLIQKGTAFVPSNHENTFNGGEDANIFGVVRPGRTDKLFREHIVY
tara:strand:- start:19235 stop:19582 length:348 start_codon:yes stop_codon:yes gene_type:complete